MMAKRWLIAATLVLALGGCTDDPEAEPVTVPVPTTSSDAPASQSPAAAATQTTRTHAAAAPQVTRTAPGGFVAAVQSTLPEVAVDRRDEEIAGIGQQACSSLAAGKKAGAVVAETERFGTDEASARTLIGLAIGTVCPDQDRRITEF